MRLVNEFVVAASSDVPRLARNRPDRGRFPYFRCFDLDLQATINLYFLLRGEAYRDEFLREFAILHRASTPGCAIVRLPDRFTRSLADAGTADLSRACARWSENGDISMRCWPVDYRRRVLDNLARLARQSRHSGKPVLLCIRVDDAG